MKANNKKNFLLFILIIKVLSCGKKEVVYEPNVAQEEIKTVSNNGIIEQVEEDVKEKLKQEENKTSDTQNKDSNGFVAGKITFDNITGKYSGTKAGYMEIKQEANDYYVRFGKVSQAEFFEELKKNPDPNLMYENEVSLSGKFGIEVYNNWFKLIPKTENFRVNEFNQTKDLDVLEIENISQTNEIYLYQSSIDTFKIAYDMHSKGNSTSKNVIGVNEYVKGNINEYKNINNLKYLELKDITELELY